jgi:enediyne biosynthesis protein CalE5
MVSSAPDPSKVEKFRQRLKQEWTDADTIAAWRKWHAQIATFTRGATDAILEAAQLEPGMHVLDLASGVGDPALSVAQAVAPTGRVTASDLGRGMFSLAEELAQKRGITNLEFREANVEALPFADRSFDALTCRFAVMLFPDTAKALRESLRVLRPGGRAAFVAFGKREQPFFTATLAILFKYVQPPPSDPDAPHLFMFGERGRLRREMENAGFAKVQEEFRTVPAHWSGTAEEYWEQFSEVAAPFRPLIAKLTPEARRTAVAESVSALNKFSDGDGLTLPLEIVIGTGTR